MPKLKLCPCGAAMPDASRFKRCERCGRGVARRNKRTTSEYGYDHQWRLMSERVRAEQPTCERCESLGVVAAATEVHHKISIEEAPWLRLSRDNLMAVCRTCHREIERQAGD